MSLSALGTATGGASIVLQSDGSGAGLLAGGLLFLLFFFGLPLVLAVATIAGQWKVFEKAGQPGWAAIVPIYNIYVACEIADRDAIWLILALFVPFAFVVPLMDLAKKFGKGAGFGVGLYLLPVVFWPLLGFGDAQYQGSTV